MQSIVLGTLHRYRKDKYSIPQSINTFFVSLCALWRCVVGGIFVKEWKIDVFVFVCCFVMKYYIWRNNLISNIIAVIHYIHHVKLRLSESWRFKEQYINVNEFDWRRIASRTKSIKSFKYYKHRKIILRRKTCRHCNAKCI